MKPRTRKCKGVNTARDYKGCGEQKSHHWFGLCKSCFINWCFNTKKGKEYFEKQQLRNLKKIQAEQKSDWRKRKAKLKEKTTNWKLKLQTEINRIVRLIDKGQPCLARGNYPNRYDAGHVFSVGSNQTIRFNLHNIHRQSKQSNHYQADDGLMRDGLSNEYGADYLKFVSELRRTPSLNLNNGGYKELTIQARRIVKRLTQADKTYTKSERIELRNQINNELGIYESEFCEFTQSQPL